LAQFVEQPHVLDRDHRLVGERGEQLDLASVNGRMERHASTSTPIGVPLAEEARRGWSGVRQFLVLDYPVRAIK